ncbi:hypothetical protein GALMADRAFT_148063 [Galerina marginata CBS 339.88]|uniref:Uncharacterized protein n=1 Tax=Galerina marginata (strain CBS 339.88) TaxID=685588 RepID=A0A067SHB4_GALM3|nr:hypothetical protein GALMADRAFT_148063 [Galerina marginata CBS 339.88]
MGKKRPASPTAEYTIAKRQKADAAPRGRPRTRSSMVVREPTPERESAEESSPEEEAPTMDEESAREESPVRAESPVVEESSSEEESPAVKRRLVGVKRKFTERSPSSDPPATIMLGPHQGKPYILVPRLPRGYPSNAPTSEAPAAKAPIAADPNTKAKAAAAAPNSPPVHAAKAASAKPAPAKAAATKAATAKKSSPKLSKVGGAAAKARHAKAQKPKETVNTSSTEPSRKRQRLEAEDAIDQVKTDEEGHEYHPTFGLDLELPVHRYKFFDFVYYSNVAPTPGNPGAVETLTMWWPPKAKEFRSVPAGHVVPIRARNQCDRATRFLADFGLPWGPRQGDHTDGDESEEVFEDQGRGKKDGGDENANTMKKVDNGKRVQVREAEQAISRVRHQGLYADEEQSVGEAKKKPIDKGKGKQREVDIDDDYRPARREEKEAAVGVEVEDGVPVHQKIANRGGRPSNAYRDDCSNLTVFYETSLVEIVEKHNRKMGTVQKDVGYVPVQSEHRAPSLWVAYEKVYSQEHPKPANQSIGDYIKECSVAYAWHLGTLRDEELAAWRVELFAKAAKLNQQAPKKSIGSRLAAAEKLVYECIHGITAEDPEIQIFAGMTYVGDDHAGLQFPGKCMLSSTLLVNAVSKCALPVNQLLNRATGLTRGEFAASRINSSVNDQKTGVVLSTKVMGASTTARVAKVSTAAKATDVAGAVIIDGVQLTPEALGRKWALHEFNRFAPGRANFPWRTLCNLAVKHQFYVIWPSSVDIFPGGPGFTVGALVARNWVSLVAGMQAKDFKEGADTSHLRFRLDYWTEDQVDCNRSSEEYYKIPLVVSDIGTVLVTIQDNLTQGLLVAEAAAKVKASSHNPPQPSVRSSHTSTSFVAKPNIPSTRPLSPMAVSSSHHVSLRQPDFIEGSSKPRGDPRDRSLLVDTFERYHQMKAQAAMEPIDVDEVDDVEFQQGLHNSYTHETRPLPSRGDLGPNQYTNVTYSHGNRYSSLSHSSKPLTTHQAASYSGRSSKSLVKPSRQVASYSGQPSHSVAVKPSGRDIFYNPILRGPPSNRTINRIPSVGSSPIEDESPSSDERPQISPIHYNLPKRGQKE